jgi:GAF domain-containing protein
LDPEKNLLSFPYFVDQLEEKPQPQKPGRGLTEYVLRTGKSILVNPEVFNLLVEEQEVETVGPPSVDWLGVPLKVENRVIGVMGAQSYSEGIRYKYRDEQMMAFVSTQVAMAIDR